MATLVQHCTTRSHHTICPECGRVAPDFCVRDEPEGYGKPPDLLLTGSDIPEESVEEASVPEETDPSEEKVKDALKKIRGRKVEQPQAEEA